MDIEKRKTEAIALMDELEMEVGILLRRIQKAKTVLPSVKTIGDAEKFDTDFDFEEGLKHIELNI